MNGATKSSANRCHTRQQGTALLIVLIALLIFSVIGLYLALIATAEVRISDNFESSCRARSAALAGLNHARALLKGIRFDDLLEGPDGTYDQSPAYLVSAKSHSFRMPLAWSTARTLDIADPAGAVVGISDDGLINTGRHAGGNGLILIPLEGISHVAANPNGPGMLTTARYFVKVADNSSEPAEVASDPADSPFVDGDGQIVLRSMGIAQTLAVGLNAGARSNSVVVYEARFKRFSTYVLDAPVVVESSAVEPAAAEMFSGSSFLIQGGPGTPGIALIDTVPQDGVEPSQEILSRLGADQMQCVQGAGPGPPIRDITPAVTAHAEKRLLLDKASSWRFLRQSVPRFADSTSPGPQTWIGVSPVPLGKYDPALSPASPGQDPRVTYVDGDLFVDGNLEGGGLLLITGKATMQGNFNFNGLILVLGAGELDIRGWSTVSGAILVAKLSDVGGTLSWGTAKLSVGDNCRIQYDLAAIRAAVSLIPAVQLGCREITPVIDP